MRHRRHNFRLAGGFLSIVLMIMVTTTGGAWRCLDGTLCPTGPMMSATKALTSVEPPATTFAHACCSSSVHDGTKKSSLASAGMQCLLSLSDRPVASVERGTADIHAAAVTLPIPMVLGAPPAPHVAAAPFFAIPPPPILDARLGRAPPPAIA